MEITRPPASLSQARYRASFRAAAHGILLADGDTYEILDINPMMASLLGCSASAVNGKRLWDIPFFAQLQAADGLSQKLHQTKFLRFEDLFITSKGGKSLVVEVIFLEYLVGTNRTIECCIRDITQRKRKEVACRHASTLKALARMAARVSDEFNRLLPVMGACSDLVLNSVNRGPSLQKTVDELQKARERVATLARDMLTFSGKQALPTQRVDLNSLLRSLEPVLRANLGQAIELVTDLAAELPAILAGAGQIEQALLALAAAARDAMPQGGTLRLATSEVGAHELAGAEPGAPAIRYVRLHAGLRGARWDDATWRCLFEPSWGGNREDTGLGLATVYAIVKQSCGYISVSESEEGTNFRIDLPVRPEKVDAPAASAAAQGPATILLMAQGDGLRTMLRNLLARKGYGVLEAAGEDEARGLLDTQTVHLLIATVGPGESLQPWLRETAVRHRTCRVLSIVELSENKTLEPGHFPPEVAVLSKPFRLEELLEKVRELLLPGSRKGYDI